MTHGERTKSQDASCHERTGNLSVASGSRSVVQCKLFMFDSTVEQPLSVDLAVRCWQSSFFMDALR
jgi:hypothetical protein